MRKASLCMELIFALDKLEPAKNADAACHRDA